ncbi:glycine cleavage system aminomethyltransferase GcvT [Gordonia sp. i37]|uniref:glycine cleavage system aminomethyltransferase GcvT n=1 Tax=Gordonia sp. i37 TaxID=1961707 RepID=UPI0009AE143F|nr:glycine cleavage system aminomethyltransferase GcvT [Gordonia sp. i37]OPX05210.1 glycine cleavage system protein T [Gordonia sp. i37]
MTITTTPVSPLLGEHHSLGAHFTDFAGWQMPLKYVGDLAEHHAVRTAAGLFDLSHMGEIAIEGPDAAAVLDYALVGQLSTTASGRAKYSLICTADGGVIDDLVVYRLADDRFLVVANAANTRRVCAEFDSRAEGFDVAVNDQSAETALIAVQGPQAQAIVAALVAGPDRAAVAELKYYAAASAVVAEIDVLLARTGYTGEDGFELYVPNEHAVPLWQALLTETRTCGGTPAGLACRDTLRLEAGMALYGHELTLHTNPYEAGLGKVVRLDTSFVGRDALAALADQPPTRTLVGLVGTGRRAARADYPVLDTSGQEIGTVTSGALSPTLGYPIAMAYVDLAHAHPGTEVSVDIRGNAETYTVTPRQFYHRSATS